VHSIRVFAKNLGDPYYEPTIVVHDNNNIRFCYVTYRDSYLALNPLLLSFHSFDTVAEDLLSVMLGLLYILLLTASSL